MESYRDMWNQKQTDNPFKRIAVRMADMLRKPFTDRDRQANVVNKSRKSTVKLKVLHIYKFLYDGGTERYIHTLISRMNPERFEFQICCLMERGSEAEKFENDGFPVHQLHFKPGLSPAVLPGNLIQVFLLARLIRKLGIDIVHTHDNQPAAYARLAAWLARVPIVYVTLHNDYDWITPMQHRVNRLLAGLTTRFFTVSKTVRDLSISRDHIAQDKYHVIYNGVHFPEPVDQAKIKHFREIWKLEPDAWVIGNVASLSRRKGQDVLVEAFGKIATEFPHAYLFIVGSARNDEPDVEQELIGIASRYGIRDRVILTGSRNDVLDLLGLFDICAMPSRVEGFGLALVEAICAGVPALVSDIPTFMEICQDGQYALPFRKDDSEDLAEKLRHTVIHQDAMKQLADTAQQYAKSRFSIESMVAQYERIYEQDINAAGV